ncbi:MAG: OB-fold nucleic acid binding domain-containing protein, partial [Anaerolineales bacterium]|nr:OB-fold nucleic acid binding domain-containing protein [Anaerolineales bacterium]
MADLNELERIRAAKIEGLRQAGLEAYPARAQRTHTTRQALAAFEDQGDLTGAVTVVGRLRSMRSMGKTTFCHIEDGHGRLQLYFRVDDLGQERLNALNDLFDLGDFVQASGALFRTRTGEITLHVTDFHMLAKAVSPLPASKEELVDGTRLVHSAFDNPEARYRQRYADLAVNPEVRDLFATRAGVVRALREFLDSLGFIEVETPVLQPLYGGAAAQPFVTHHNQLHQDLYLRISFELYLKRLLVGGFERVYEIGRDFRNEGVSFKHNPEFTQLEFYMAYADYLQVMDVTEQMVAHAAQQATGSTTIVYDGHTINLAPPWKRMTLRQAIREHSGIDIAEHPDADSLRLAMAAHGHEPAADSTRGKLIDSLLAH